MIFVEALPLNSVSDVRLALQKAIEIEHATIPPYLTALHSLGDEGNDDIRGILRGIVVEEMGHMALVANILNAVGGSPSFTDRDFIPSYPGGLPFHIGDRDGNTFSINLVPFSLSVVRDTFMRIEEPDVPIEFPVKALALVAADTEFKTIGDFYGDLASTLEDLGPGCIVGDVRHQVAGFPGEVFAIASLTDALDAIKLIVKQGEGTTTEPLAGQDGALAHYYRFAEIANGKTLVKDANSSKGYSYSGPPISLDVSKVAKIIINPSSGSYQNAPLAARLSRQFNDQYSALLSALQNLFNGEVQTVAQVVGLMFDCKLTAQKMMQTRVEGSELFAAPTYEYHAMP